MTDKILTTLLFVSILIGMGLLIGAFDRARFSWRWLLAAAVLLIINDAALSSLFGAIPDLFPGSSWNWQGKILALLASLAIAAHPAFGFARAGITLRQNEEGRTATYVFAAVLCLIFAAIAVAADNEPVKPDTLAFQLTMPGFEEEAFSRGVFLLALNEAFRGRWRALGIDWGWGAILSCLIFGLGHTLEVGSGGLSFDAFTLLTTGGPALLLIWLRERTGSIVLPVLLHNYANSITLLL